jgi:protein-S-isoprenylcysteine O-methyltransferase Ste14
MGIALHFLTVIVLTAGFVAFAVASYRHFQPGESRGNTVIRALSLLASIGFLAMAVHMPAPHPAVSGLGLGLGIGAIAVFRSATSAVPKGVLDVAFTGTGPERLIRNGIYARVRHPLYLAYLLYWLGWAAALAAAWPAVLGLAVFAGLYVLAARQEEAYLQSRFESDFQAHRQNTGLFWPVFR